MDKFFLGLKLKKELGKAENCSDPNAHRYTNMSYINFLNRQQRLIENGLVFDDFDDDQEGQSEDDSNSGDNKTKSKASPMKVNEATKTPISAMLAQTQV